MQTPQDPRTKLRSTGHFGNRTAYRVFPVHLGFHPIATNEPRSTLKAGVESEDLMRRKKRNAIVLLVISLILFTFEASIWARSTARARSETDKQNIFGRYQPTEIPAIAGALLLFAAMAVAATPQSRKRKHSKNI